MRRGSRATFCAECDVLDRDEYAGEPGDRERVGDVEAVKDFSVRPGFMPEGGF
jgi:hypothetical protein